MGIRCTKHGFVNEEGSVYGDQFRLGPEGGECRSEMAPTIFSLSSCSDLALLSTPRTDRRNLKTTHGLVENSHGLGKGLAKTLLVTADIRRECQEVDLLHRNSKTHLPPEGKADVEQQFVELPKKLRKSSHTDELVVSLEDDSKSLASSESGQDLSPMEEESKDDILSICKVDLVSLPDLQSDRGSVHSDNQSAESLPCHTTVKSDSPVSLSDEEQTVHDPQYPNIEPHDQPSNGDWTYTLYDYNGEGIATKQDLQQLMQSICSVVGSSVLKASNCNDMLDRSLKVRLEIGHQNKHAEHSPNKYTPSKNYNGFLFPPPNSTEADKVSTYIEEKLSLYQEKMNRRDRKERHERRHERRHHRHIHHGESSLTHDEQSHSDHGVLEQNYALPKRQLTYPGGCPSTTMSSSSDGKCSSYSRKTNSSNRKFPVNSSQQVLSTSKLRNSVDSFLQDSTQASAQRHSDSSWLVSDDNTNCSESATSHLRTSTNGRTNENETECNIRLKHSCTRHRQLKEERLKRQSSSSNDSLKNESSSSCIAPSTLVNAASDKNNFHRRRKSGHRSPDSELHSASLSSSCSSSHFSGSLSSKRRSGPSSCTSSVPSHSRDQRKNHIDSHVTVHRSAMMQTGSYSERPDVWPGGCLDMADERNALVSSGLPSHHMCFCQRMLGKDQPCCSSVAMQHTHTHEHHHYHYYVPAAATAR